MAGNKSAKKDNRFLAQAIFAIASLILVGFENVCFTKENPTVLSFAYPEDIEAMDTDGTLRLYRGFSHNWSRHGIEYRYLPYIDQTFSLNTLSENILFIVAIEAEMFVTNRSPS